MDKQQTKAIPEFPRALYGCEEQGCAEEESHFPEDLWLITNPPKGWYPGWYCEGCADEARFQNPDTKIGETLEHYLGMERDRLRSRNAELEESLELALAVMEKMKAMQGEIDRLKALNAELLEALEGSWRYVWHKDVEAKMLAAIAKAEGSN